MLEKYKDFPSFMVGFRTGYRMNSPFAACLCRLKEEWGAEKGRKYYVLEILKIYR